MGECDTLDAPVLGTGGTSPVGAIGRAVALALLACALAILVACSRDTPPTPSPLGAETLSTTSEGGAEGEATPTTGTPEAAPSVVTASTDGDRATPTPPVSSLPVPAQALNLEEERIRPSREERRAALSRASPTVAVPSPSPTSTPAIAVVPTPRPIVARNAFHLEIPRIGVSAPVVTLGVDGNGVMQSPQAPNVVAWYDFSARPGQPGNAVFSGHLDWRTGITAVFWRLRDLRPGDGVVVHLPDAEPIRYVVSDTKLYVRTNVPLDQIIGSAEGEVITLITCEGTFDPVTQDYSHRRVVRAGRG